MTATPKTARRLSAISANRSVGNQSQGGAKDGNAVAESRGPGWSDAERGRVTRIEAMLVPNRETSELQEFIQALTNSEEATRRGSLSRWAVAEGPSESRTDARVPGSGPEGSMFANDILNYQMTPTPRCSRCSPRPIRFREPLGSRETLPPFLIDWGPAESPLMQDGGRRGPRRSFPAYSRAYSLEAGEWWRHSFCIPHRARQRPP